MSDETTLIIVVLVCFQIKHFVADYMLQPLWMIRDKGHLDQAGGYIHAGIHALGSIPALLVAGLSLAPLALMIAAEFVIHFAVDHTKARISMKGDKGPSTAAFWALHGADQLIHHLTYIAMAVIATLWAVSG